MSGELHGQSKAPTPGRTRAATDQACRRAFGSARDIRGLYRARGCERGIERCLDAAASPVHRRVRSFERAPRIAEKPCSSTCVSPSLVVGGDGMTHRAQLGLKQGYNRRRGALALRPHGLRCLPEVVEMRAEGCRATAGGLQWHKDDALCFRCISGRRLLTPQRQPRSLSQPKWVAASALARNAACGGHV